MTLCLLKDSFDLFPSAEKVSLHLFWAYPAFTSSRRLIAASMAISLPHRSASKLPVYMEPTSVSVFSIDRPLWASSLCLIGCLCFREPSPQTTVAGIQETKLLWCLIHLFVLIHRSPRLPLGVSVRRQRQDESKPPSGIRQRDKWRTRQVIRGVNIQSAETHRSCHWFKSEAFIPFLYRNKEIKNPQGPLSGSLRIQSKHCYNTFPDCTR